MAVFRGPETNEPENDKIANETDTNENFTDPDEYPYERRALDYHRQRFGKKRAQYRVANSRGTSLEASRLQRYSIGSGLNRTGGSLISNKRIAAGLGFLAGPTLIGILLFVIAMNAGLTIEHIYRITNGLRFGAFHSSLAKRNNHLRRNYIRVSYASDSAFTANSTFSKYTKSSLGSRLLGVDSENILDRLHERGWRMENKRGFKGSTTVIGRRVTRTIQKPGQTASGEPIVVEIKNSKQALDVIDEVRYDFDNTPLDRYKAWRSSLLVAKQTGIPFLRFRAVIHGLRDGTLKSIARDYPGIVKQGISETIAKNKARLRPPNLIQKFKKIGGVGDDLDKAVDDLTVTAVASSTQGGGVTKATLLKRTAGFFSKHATAFKTVTTISTAAAVLTFVCTFREIGSLFVQAHKMRSRGMQDNATTVTTVASQARDGDVPAEVIGDLSSHFDGFATTAHYQVAAKNRPAQDYFTTSASTTDNRQAGLGLANQQSSENDLVPIEGYNFAGIFAMDSIFEGWRATSLLKISSWFQLENLKSAVGDFLDNIPGVLGFFASIFGSVAKSIIGKISGFLEKTCGNILDIKFQIGLVVAEVLLMVISVIVTGGAAGIIGGGFRAALLPTLQLLASRAVLGRVALVGATVAAGISMDKFVFEHVLPNLTANASGVETMLLRGEGPRNYASVDYGMHYLKEAEALASGGSSIPVTEAVSQTQAYLELDRQRENSKGLLASLFSFDNPYSPASNLAVSLNSSRYNLTKQSQFWLTNLVSLRTFNVWQPVRASDSRALQELLYPGQTHVVGFLDEDIDGETELNHIENTLYVESNMERLKNDYSHCLGVEASDFFISQIPGADFLNDLEDGDSEQETDKKYSYEVCEHHDARKYKMYYLDCNLTESLALLNSGSSPMFSSQCDDLLTPSKQSLLENLPEPDSDTINLEELVANLPEATGGEDSQLAGDSANCLVNLMEQDELDCLLMSYDQDSNVLEINGQLVKRELQSCRLRVVRYKISDDNQVELLDLDSDEYPSQDVPANDNGESLGCLARLSVADIEKNGEDDRYWAIELGVLDESGNLIGNRKYFAVHVFDSLIKDNLKDVDTDILRKYWE